jgi:hypothetical protein
MSTTKNTTHESDKTASPQKPGQKAAELKTEGPLSEKDEVKKAEDRTNKGSGKK